MQRRFVESCRVRDAIRRVLLPLQWRNSTYGNRPSQAEAGVVGDNGFQARLGFRGENDLFVIVKIDFVEYKGGRTMVCGGYESSQRFATESDAAKMSG